MSYPWFALQVRSRYENIVTAHLGGKGYEWFLPLYKCRRRWSDRFKEIECPLFAGYIFCRLNPLDRLRILTTSGVVRIAGVARPPIAIDQPDFAAIRAAVRSGLPTQPGPCLALGPRITL